MTSPNELRVLSIAHTAVSRTAGRLRYKSLRKSADLKIRLIVPQRWYQFGRWLEAEPPHPDDVETRALPILVPRAGPAKWYLHIYRHLLREVRDFRPDVIHLWEEPWSIVALQASLISRLFGTALVLEVDQNILKWLPPPFETIRRFVLSRTDLLLSRTRLAYDVARDCGFRGPRSQIGYGVDQSLFFPPAERTPNGPLHLGYVGRLVQEKGVDDLLRAAARATTDIRVTIVGEGIYERALRALTQQLGIAHRVTFHPWANPGQVADILRGLDVLALLTRTTATVCEQFGRVIIEAQACGTPVIGSTSGAIPDIVGEGGWIVPESDPTAIAALLNRLGAAPEEILHRSALGLTNVTERFTHAGIAHQLQTAWEQARDVRAMRANPTLRKREAMASWFTQP